MFDKGINHGEHRADNGSPLLPGEEPEVRETVSFPHPHPFSQPEKGVDFVFVSFMVQEKEY